MYCFAPIARAPYSRACVAVGSGRFWAWARARAGPGGDRVVLDKSPSEGFQAGA